MYPAQLRAAARFSESFSPCVALVLSLLAAQSGTVFAAEPDEAWSRFRGPNGSGVSRAASVPAQWKESDYNWKLELPGLGHSSPVVWGDHIFLLTADEDTGARRVLCVSASQGQTVWQREFVSAPHRKHKKNSLATSTPAVDADHIYVTWADGDRITFKALRHNDPTVLGQTAWEVDLGPFKGGHGFGSSPIVHADLVVLPIDQDGASSLVALDRKTGQLRWKVDRKSQRTTYSTPCVFAPPGRDPLLIFTDWNHGITAIDPKNGALVWEKSVFGESTERAIGSPVVAGELVIGTCGFVTSTKHVVALKPGPSTNTEVAEVYHLERGAPHIPSVLVLDDLLFLWADNGIVTCCEVATGKTLWQRRIGGTYMASPICVGGKLYNVSEDGEVLVLAAAREYEELGRVNLGDECHATPAVVNGALILRTHRHLFSIGGKSAE